MSDGLPLGLGVETSAHVEVRWPSGLEEKSNAVAADQLVVIKEGTGVLAGAGWSKGVSAYPR